MHISLSDFASIACTASGLAAVVSLIYLGLQSHQAAKNQRGTMHQMRAVVPRRDITRFGKRRA